MGHLLAESAQPRMEIHFLDDNPTTRFAASEMRYYLSLMTGAAFSVQRGAAGKGVISFALVNGELGEDGFSLVSDDDGIRISGGRRGVIYGAYEFLERLGCRFFAPDCEDIPVAETLEVPVFSTTQVPRLEYREHNYKSVVQSARFAVKCRLNGNSNEIPARLGGHMTYARYVHTFTEMLPPQKYAKTHPEYYALVDGSRAIRFEDQFQPCLTNPDVLRVCTESVREALRAHPEARIISISQNDCQDACQCDACRASDAADGSPAGTMLKFVNAIAEALEPEFPDVIFDTLAYQYTRPAPRITRPRKNVCVRLCSIECCFSHPLETCDDETRHVTRPDGSVSSFLTDLNDWSKVCNRMYIWDYTTCFAHYPTPHPNWHALQPNMRTFLKNNVRGVFEQANGAYGGGVDLNDLRAYVIAKLLWDAETDVNRHIREFTDCYYGAAGPMIREYLELYTRKAETDNIHVGFNDPPLYGFLTEDMLDRYDEIFDRAEAAVAGDPICGSRVKKARLAIRYVRIKRKAMLRHEHDAAEINAFFRDWRAFQLTRINEWVDLEYTQRALVEDKWRGEEFLPHWSDERIQIL